MSALLILAGPVVAEGGPLSSDEAHALLQRVDEQRHLPSLKFQAVIEDTQGDQRVVREALVYSLEPKDGDDKFEMLFTAPKTEAGNGYLRLGQNLWFYDARLGHWERRTSRERIAGTGANASDLRAFRMSDAYSAQDEGEELLGQTPVRKLLLKAREDVDVAFPVVRVWIDKNHLLLKQQEYALSGKLLRTALTTRLHRLKGPEHDVLLPREIRIYDEIDKTRTTTVVVKTLDPSALSPELFTKAWLEGKSR